MAFLVQTFVLPLLWFSFILFRSYSARRDITKRHGCKPPTSLTGHRNIFGLDLVYLFLNSSRRGLEKLSVEEQFDVLGSTFQTQAFIKPVIKTIEPRNIQAVFASDADSFGNGPLRHFSFSPLVGDGVMTLDGARHERARALIRPTFSKANIENETAYSMHLENFIKLLPTDGSTVDLQPLFGRLDLDSSTEFIFGESVASLTTDSLIDPNMFPAAFTKAQKEMEIRFQIPPFNFLHRDKSFWDAAAQSANL
jgi:cytochrome P450